MWRKANPLFLAAGALGLATLGSDGTPAQEVKAVLKQEPVKAVPKAPPPVVADDAIVQQVEQLSLVWQAHWSAQACRKRMLNITRANSALAVPS